MANDNLLLLRQIDTTNWTELKSLLSSDGRSLTLNGALSMGTNAISSVGAITSSGLVVNTMAASDATRGNGYQWGNGEFNIRLNTAHSLVFESYNSAAETKALTLTKDGNATFAGTINSGAITSSALSLFKAGLTVGDDAANVNGIINLIASDGDAGNIAINTSDALTFNLFNGGYAFNDGDVFIKNGLNLGDATHSDGSILFYAEGGAYYAQLIGSNTSGSNKVIYLPNAGGTVALTATTLSGYGITDAQRSYDIYNSTTEAGLSAGNTAAATKEWTESNGGNNIKIRTFFTYRTGNKTLGLRAYGKDDGKVTLDVPTISSANASWSSGTYVATTVSLDISTGYTNNQVYEIDVTLEELAAAQCYIKNVVISVENY